MRMRILHIVWWTVLVWLLVTGLSGMVLIYRRPQLVAIPQFIELVAGLGVPVWLFTTAAHLVPILVSAAMAIAMFRGKPHDPVALGFGWALLGTFVYAAGAPRAVAAAVPRLALVAVVAEVLAIAPLLVLLYVFPDGRFRPRWTRWMALGLIVALLVIPHGPAEARLYMMDPSQPRWAAAAFALVLAVWICTAVPSQVLRYRRYSDAAGRQQVRWVLLGFAALIIPVPILGLLVLVRAPGWLIGGSFVLLAGISLAFPLASGIAVFRYRLFELDRVMTRTVGYSVVTVVLAGVYVTSVFVLRPLLPGEGDLAVAASTLAVAALFGPIRSSIQTIVDRRFHRSRYNAQGVVEQFADRLRDDVDVGAVAADLRAAVAATVQPTHLTLWLRVDESPYRLMSISDEISPDQACCDSGESAPVSG